MNVSARPSWISLQITFSKGFSPDPPKQNKRHKEQNINSFLNNLKKEMFFSNVRILSAVMNFTFTIITIVNDSHVSKRKFIKSRTMYITKNTLKYLQLSDDNFVLYIITGNELDALRCNTELSL